MIKSDIKRLRDAWRRFDRVTAFACRARKQEFDEPRCRTAWEIYCEVERSLGILNAQSPFTSDTLKLPSYKYV